MIHLKNNGPDIAAWTLPADFRGGEKFLVDINARAFRLILPRALHRWIAEMETGEIVHIERGAWSQLAVVSDGYRIMFDDATENPFTLFTRIEAGNLLSLPADSGRVDILCSVWIDRRGDPHCALRRPATYEDKRRIR